MTYRGQEIYRFELRSDQDLFEEHQKLVRRFTRFMQLALAGLGIAVFAREYQSFSLADTLLWFGFITLALAGLDRMSRRKPETLEEVSPLVIYEYGMEVSTLFSSDKPGSTFLTFNQILEVRTEDLVLLIRGGEDSYTVPVLLVQPEDEDLFYPLMERIAAKVEGIENRKHPTIIPRAYFKDLLS